MFLFNRILDLIFIGDMGVQFCLMVETESFQSSARGTVWLTKRGAIAKNYLQGWFALDLLSILVSAFDCTGFAVVQSILGASNSASLSKLKIFRVMRVLRLVKLFRLLRASRMIKRWESRLAVNYALLSLVRSVLCVVLLGHWFACVWILQAKLQDDTSKTWMGTHVQCEPLDAMDAMVDDAASASASVASGGRRLSAAASSAANEELLILEWECPTLESYMAALYFATATITSIGYGDISSTRYNWVEQVVSCLLMLISDVTWCWVMGVFVSVITNSNPERTYFRTTMDELNRLISRERLSSDLAVRMRSYFHQSRHLRAAKQQKHILASLPPTLQGEVSWATNSQWLSRIFFLRECDPAFMLELSLQMHAVVFAPSDVAPEGYLFVMQRGVALYNGRVLTKGHAFGEDMILRDTTLRSRATARAMNYVEANYVARVELLMLAGRYPETSKQIRRAAILVSLRREIIRIAAFAQEMAISPEHRGKTSRSLLLDWYGTVERARRAAAGHETSFTAGQRPKSTGGNILFGGGSMRARRGSVASVVHSRGGRLEGYAKDLGVQFEIVNAEIAQLRSDMGQIRGDSATILQALTAAGIIKPPAAAAAAAAEPVEIDDAPNPSPVLDALTGGALKRAGGAAAPAPANGGWRTTLEA